MLFDLSRSLTLALALTGMVRCTANPETIIQSRSVEPDSVADTLDFPRMPEFLPAPDVEARQSQKKPSDNDRWAKVAQQKGKEAFEQAWTRQVSSLSKPVTKANTAQQKALCPQITRSVVDSCKRGVRTQTAYCKQAKKDSIAKCKNDVRSKIDKCKKNTVFKPACERFRPEIPKCETNRIDVPLCEVDRLTAACCEGLRSQAGAMCSAGVSTASIQKQVQSAQAMCSVAAGLAKTAMKSYLSGQALGFLTQLESIQAIGDTVQVLKKADQTRAQFEQWSSGLQAAVEGRMKDAQKSLGSLASQISPGIGNAVAWADAAQAAVTKNIDAFLAKAAVAAGELEAIEDARETIAKLKNVADNIGAVKKAAEQCAKLPSSIKPEQYSGWKSVTSQAGVEAAVKAYKMKFDKTLYEAAKCQAVVTRAMRVMK